MKPHAGDYVYNMTMIIKFRNLEIIHIRNFLDKNFMLFRMQLFYISVILAYCSTAKNSEIGNCAAQDKVLHCRSIL